MIVLPIFINDNQEPRRYRNLKSHNYNQFLRFGKRSVDYQPLLLDHEMNVV